MAPGGRKRKAPREDVDIPVARKRRRQSPGARAFHGPSDYVLPAERRVTRQMTRNNPGLRLYLPLQSDRPPAVQPAILVAQRGSPAASRAESEHNTPERGPSATPSERASGRQASIESGSRSARQHSEAQLSAASEDSPRIKSEPLSSPDRSVTPSEPVSSRQASVESGSRSARQPSEAQSPAASEHSSSIKSEPGSSPDRSATPSEPASSRQASIESGTRSSRQYSEAQSPTASEYSPRIKSEPRSSSNGSEAQSPAASEHSPSIKSESRSSPDRSEAPSPEPDPRTGPEADDSDDRSNEPSNSDDGRDIYNLRGQHPNITISPLPSPEPPQSRGGRHQSTPNSGSPHNPSSPADHSSQEGSTNQPAPAPSDQSSSSEDTNDQSSSPRPGGMLHAMVEQARTRLNQTRASGPATTPTSTPTNFFALASGSPGSFSSPFASLRPGSGWAALDTSTPAKTTAGLRPVGSGSWTVGGFATGASAALGSAFSPGAAQSGFRNPAPEVPDDDD